MLLGVALFVGLAWAMRSAYLASHKLIFAEQAKPLVWWLVVGGLGLGFGMLMRVLHTSPSFAPTVFIAALAWVHIRPKPKTGPGATLGDLEKLRHQVHEEITLYSRVTHPKLKTAVGSALFFVGGLVTTAQACDWEGSCSYVL